MKKRYLKKKKTLNLTNGELQSIISQLKNKNQINKNIIAVVNKTGKMLCINANNEEKTVIYHNCMIMSDRF